jgi:hypothetical protein
MAIYRGDGGAGVANPTYETAVIADQTGNSGKYLTTDGSNTSWVVVSGTGTVTSVAMSGGTTGLTTTGGPIITSGTFTLGGTLAVANGGTNATTASGARTNILPSYAGNAGKVLAVNAGATDVEYITVSGGGGSGTVTSITAGTGLTGGTITTSGTIAIDSTVATLTGSQTLTNKVISGSSNTLSNIGNGSLTNSAITINGTSTSLGGSILVGTVTSASVVSANGFAGTVATSTTTPEITISTSVNGIIKGNGTAMSAAVSGTDYAPATSGTSILYGNGSGGFSNVTIGSGLAFSAGTLSASGGGGMTYPSGTGIAVVTSGTSWGTTLTAPTGTIVGTTDTQTLSGKTLTDPIITGTITEDVFTITDGAGFAIDPTNGSIQLVTLGANRTPTQANWASGESVTLMVDDGSARTITWTTIGVTWVGGSAPTLATTGYTIIELWKVSTTIYGVFVGSA